MIAPPKILAIVLMPDDTTLPSTAFSVTVISQYPGFSWDLAFRRHIDMLLLLLFFILFPEEHNACCCCQTDAE